MSFEKLKNFMKIMEKNFVFSQDYLLQYLKYSNLLNS